MTKYLCLLPADQTCFADCNVSHYDDLGNIEAGKRRSVLSFNNSLTAWNTQQHADVTANKLQELILMNLFNITPHTTIKCLYSQIINVKFDPVQTTWMHEPLTDLRLLYIKDETRLMT